MGNAVVDAILAATQDPDVRAAMLLGSKLESGWTTSAVGDHGTSFGPFQIHLPAHPGVTAAQASNAQFAVNYILPEYQKAAASVPASQWKSDPKGAARLAAYRAERPAVIYPQGRVDTAWPDVAAALGGKTDFGAGGSSGAPAGAAQGAPTDPLSGVVDSITNSIGAPFQSIAKTFSIFDKLALPETWVRVGAGVFGIGLVTFGLVFLAREVRN